jgi:hypothetical protein
MSSSNRKYSSHENKLKEVEKRFNDFLDIFSQIKELGIFEVDSQGFLSPDLPRGIESKWFECTSIIHTTRAYEN